ncbi:MAG: alpha-amylase family glycosyl hydrolase [Bacteroidales bacterium]|jgi:1,4-alpha-glucan branching enzyme|nr:alpha-amylase family glycosyl hydrolase [Bacteroidales bacterium]MCI1733831.1 alpha-amylase family glycosyl hydrolase [Bacteroidales bacterium]
MRIFERDSYLEPYKKIITERYQRLIIAKETIAGYGNTLSSAVNNHLFYGVHAEKNFRVFREWAPNASNIWVIGDFNGWKKFDDWKMYKIAGGRILESYATAADGWSGDWELKVPIDSAPHGSLFKWIVQWNNSGGNDESGGTSEGERIPAYATRCVQDAATKIFSAQIWDPAKPYKWRYKFEGEKSERKNPLVYEAHIGMSGEKEGIAIFADFKKDVLPRIKKLGYNTLQIMALQEHPYYGSFGYQVSSFFALSSRFGTPEDFKSLVDTAHSMGIAVVMDIVHSHAVKNEVEGLSNFDGTKTLYFHAGPRGEHPAWGTRCFDYGKPQTIFFLLSNCKFWMQEYHLDGFRFDGITSMIYRDHGLGKSFTSYEDYFNANVDDDAITYLGLANILVHEIKHEAITIAEDMSGMPGLAAPRAEYGTGFDFRMSMGVADHWIKWIKELPDEQWNVGDMYWELVRKREDEKTISYAECHDQAMVGDKTIIFRLLDKEMYDKMNLTSKSLVIDRGIALHKMIRLLTIATAGDGYLNFMGNEFGHPEWIDFPREGNNWSYFYARRQWSLCDNKLLRYSSLNNFDAAMISLFRSGEILCSRPVSIYNDIQNQVIILSRGKYLFAFNFSPSGSYEKYICSTGAAAREGAKWQQVLDTDWKEFDGFERNERKVAHKEEFGADESGRGKISLYLPSRTAQVLRMM